MPRYQKTFSITSILVLMTSTLVIGLLLGGFLFGGSPSTAPQRSTVPTTRPSQLSTTSTSEANLSSTTPTTDPGELPQTNQKPSLSSKSLALRMQDLYAGIASDSITTALASYLTLDSYRQIKGLSNNSFDYANRLLQHFALDIEAAHALFASQGATSYVGFRADASYANWVLPNTCYNKLGYWHLPGVRLLYKVGGVTHSIGVISLISYRGEYYVVHLGAISRPSNTGYVDNPTVGTGALGPPGGC